MIGKYPKCYNRYIIHYKIENVINKHKSNKIKENSNTVRHMNNGTDHRHSKSCCDQSSPARRTMTISYFMPLVTKIYIFLGDDEVVPSIDPANYFLRYYLIMQHQPILKIVNGMHE